MSVFEPNHFTTSRRRFVIGTARQVPTIRTVGPAKAKLVLVRLARVKCLLPALEHAWKVFGMHDLRPASLDQLGEGAGEVVERALIHIVQLAVRERGPDLVGLRLGEKAIPLLALASQLGELLLLEQLGLAAKLRVLLVQLDEDG